MKITKILLAAAVIGSLSFANRVNAGDAFLSPRAKEQRSKIVATSNTDPNLAANQNFAVSPRALERQSRIATGTNNDRNLVAENRSLSGTPKSHDFPSAQAIQVAPVK